MMRRFGLAAATLIAVVSMMAIGTRTTHADPRNFQFVNASSVTIVHLYVSPSTVSSYGPDILGSGLVGPGESGTVSFDGASDDGCSYDILVVDQDGAEGHVNGVDLCSTDTVTYS